MTREPVSWLVVGWFNELFVLCVYVCVKGKRSNVKIHEDSRGGIYTVGVTAQDVHSQEEVE